MNAPILESAPRERTLEEITQNFHDAVMHFPGLTPESLIKHARESQNGCPLLIDRYASRIISLTSEAEELEPSLRRARGKKDRG